jgi:hypothetical protein
VAGIHRLAIPTPSPWGRVTVYLIEDDPLTLVDAGPNSGTSFDELQRAVAGLGHSLEEIEFAASTSTTYGVLIGGARSLHPLIRSKRVATWTPRLGQAPLTRASSRRISSSFTIKSWLASR